MSSMHEPKPDCNSELDPALVGLPAEVSDRTDFSVEEQQQSLEVYEMLYREHGSQGAQVEGLTPEELPEALRNPAITKLVLALNGGKIGLPLLAPVNHDSWYSNPYYESMYPSRSAVHLIDIPMVEAMVDGDLAELLAPQLRRLATEQALLLFDARALHIEARQQRIQAMLDQVGVSHSPHILEAYFRDKNGEIVKTEEASQTYYAGKVTLKDQTKVSADPMTLKQAYAKAVHQGIYRPNQEAGTELVENFADSEAARLWELYENPFISLSANHPCEQGMSEEQFRAFLADPKVTKIVHKNNGEIVTLCMLTEDIAVCPWVREEFYAERFPEEFAKRQILYFPDLVKDDQLGGGMAAADVVRIIAELVEYGGNEIVVAFDCCNQNAVFLPQMLDILINRAPQSNIAIQQIGQQVYRGLSLHPAT